MTSRQSRASLVQCYDAEWQDHLPPGAAVPEEEASWSGFAAVLGCWVLEASFGSLGEP